MNRFILSHLGNGTSNRYVVEESTDSNMVVRIASGVYEPIPIYRPVFEGSWHECLAYLRERLRNGETKGTADEDEG